MEPAHVNQKYLRTDFKVPQVEQPISSPCRFRHVARPVDATFGWIDNLPRVPSPLEDPKANLSECSLWQVGFHACLKPGAFIEYCRETLF